jgi:uncharacterized protein YdeI (BOF family)
MKQLLAVLLTLAFAGNVLAQTQPGVQQTQATDAPKAEGTAPAKTTHHKKSSKSKSTKTKHKAPATTEEKKS